MRGAARSLALVCAAALAARRCAALQNGLARTPPLGWSSWNAFGCGIDEEIIRGTADAMRDRGLLAAGYTYLNVDDCWAAAERDGQGQLQANASSFPGGMRALGSYLHSRGLRFGIYSSAGTQTCAGRAASLGHEASDALTWAAWGVDFLKYDNCASTGLPPQERYPAMRDALAACGRPIVYALCEWGVDNPATWAGAVGNTWRTSTDIWDAWVSVLLNLEVTEPLWVAAGPGAWNDPDSLQVGNGGLTAAEERAHFSLWALIKAPLLLGFDVRNASEATIGLVTNPEVIAINQDALGVAGRRVWSSLGPWAAAGPFARLFNYVGGVWSGRDALYFGMLPLRAAAALCEAHGAECAGFAFEGGSAGNVSAVNASLPVRLFRHIARASNASGSRLLHDGVFLRAAQPADTPAGALEVWAAPLAGGDVAVVLFNRGLLPARIVARWTDVGLHASASARVRDVWAGANLGDFVGSFPCIAPSHGVIMLRLSPSGAPVTPPAPGLLARLRALLASWLGAG